MNTQWISQHVFLMNDLIINKLIIGFELRGRSQITLAREGGGGGRQNANGLLTRGERGFAIC